MHSVIKCDSNRDPIIKNGAFVMISGIDAAAQTIDNVMRVQLTSYKYAQTKGIQYFDNLFLGNPNYQRFEKQARTQVSALSFVKKVSDFSYSLSDGVLSYTMTVDTIYGTSTVSG